MAWCPFAKRVPGKSGGLYFASPWKIIHHKTVGFSENAQALYGTTGSWPHFTVGKSGIQQHIDTDRHAYALKNASGGVETNRARAIQIETVGYPGVDAPAVTLENLVRLIRWLEATHSVPHEWPSGRPKEAVNGRDPGGHNRNVNNWIHRPGHYGHCHVPENSHWDPAYTDNEWEWLFGAPAPVEPKVPPMFNPPLSIAAWCLLPNGAAAAVAPDGAVYCEPATAYKGGANGKDYFKGRTAAKITPNTRGGYTITSTSDEKYDYPEVP